MTYLVVVLLLFFLLMINHSNKNRVINAAIQPRSGMAMVFDHNMLHDGEELKGGKKWIMRSEVMYRECGTVEKPKKGYTKAAAKVPAKQVPVTPPPSSTIPTPATATSSLSSVGRSDDVATPTAGPTTDDGSPSLL
jgi:hypothetical protein